MANINNYIYPQFSPPPHFSPPPPPAHPISPPPPPSHPVSPPPPPSHPISPPPPPPHPISPPSPHILPPPPPHVLPPPPPPAPDHHSTIIIIVVSFGGVLFLACALVALCCFLKKRKKKQQSVEEAKIVDIDEHLKIHEAIAQGPHGPKTVVLSVEDDVHIHEMDAKKTKSLRKEQETMHANANPNSKNEEINIDPKALEEGTSSSTPININQQSKQQNP